MLAWATAACSPGPPRHPVRSGDSGWVDGSTPASARAAAPLRDERWDLAAQIGALRLVAARARSEHAGGDLEGEVLASPASGYPLKGPASAAPPGSTIVERLVPAGGGAPLTYFVMIKRPPGYDPAGADWEYLVVAPDARVEGRGKLAHCGRCHAEAPHDRLFGGGR